MFVGYLGQGIPDTMFFYLKEIFPPEFANPGIRKLQAITYEDCIKEK